MLKWSNLEFKFEVGGSLVATDAMFLEPCHAVIHAKILPRLYHMLPSSSQNVSCPPPPFGDTWRGKSSLFSPFVTYIDFTLSIDISA